MIFLITIQPYIAVTGCSTQPVRQWYFVWTEGQVIPGVYLNVDVVILLIYSNMLLLWIRFFVLFAEK